MLIFVCKDQILAALSDSLDLLVSGYLFIEFCIIC